MTGARSERPAGLFSVTPVFSGWIRKVHELERWQKKYLGFLSVSARKAFCGLVRVGWT